MKADPVIIAINRYRAASAELDKIAVREPTLPNGSPADEAEEYAVWETASHKAQDVAATAWAEVTATQPTTVAGAVALINCHLEIWSEHPIKTEHQASGVLKILRSFLRSIASRRTDRISDTAGSAARSYSPLWHSRLHARREVWRPTRFAAPYPGRVRNDHDLFSLRVMQG